MRDTKPRLISAASLRQQSRRRGDRPPGSRRSERRHRPRAGSDRASRPRRGATPAAISASAHGGVRPWCEQGSSVTYAVAPRAADAGLPQRKDLGVRLARALVEPLAHHLAPAHEHATDAGFGGVEYRPRRASSSARAMYWWSSARTRLTSGSRSAVSACDHSPSCMSSTDARPTVPQPVDLLPERVHVLEAAVDRRETHVGHLVEPVQLVHHELADQPRRHLALAERAQLVADVVDRRVDRLARHRPLLERLQHARAQLGLVERLARSRRSSRRAASRARPTRTS